MLNNMLLGRAFDEFETLTLAKYNQLDKSSRFGPFSKNDDFMSICVESDNQVRNASHHGSFNYDPQSQIISYNAGKGGTGETQRMTYTSYLERCTKLYLQIVTLYRVELILCKGLQLNCPL